jgi:hypothetical protein
LVVDHKRAVVVRDELVALRLVSPHRLDAEVVERDGDYFVVARWNGGVRWWVNETDASAVPSFLLTREDDPTTTWQPSNLRSLVETMASADEP